MKPMKMTLVATPATSLPLANAEEMVPGVDRDGDNEVFVSCKDVWIIIDLATNTYSVGDYEG